jgi:TonB family protein
MRAVGSVRFLFIPLMLLGGSVSGCSERTRQAARGNDGWLRRVSDGALVGMPDERPQMLNEELPFRYPVPAYQAGVQGNVMLRLFVDSSGRVVPDSTRVVEPSGHEALDSAALLGASRLQFRPARRRGIPIPVSLLFPVHFRRPGTNPLGGDSL